MAVKTKQINLDWIGSGWIPSVLYCTYSKVEALEPSIWVKKCCSTNNAIVEYIPQTFYGRSINMRWVRGVFRRAMVVARTSLAGPRDE